MDDCVDAIIDQRFQEKFPEILKEFEAMREKLYLEKKAQGQVVDLQDLNETVLNSLSFTCEEDVLQRCKDAKMQKVLIMFKTEYPEEKLKKIRFEIQEDIIQEIDNSLDDDALFSICQDHYPDVEDSVAGDQSTIQSTDSRERMRRGNLEHKQPK